MKIPHPDLPQPDVKKSVFINCPYDSEYEIFQDAIFYTVIACGFIPRSAKESRKDSISRMERILHALYTSNYSIHDLSRYCGNEETLLSRFNMPFELGLAISKRYIGKNKPMHDWMVIVPEGAPYTHFISDLAGYDLHRYGADVTTLIRKVFGWLMTQPGATPWTSPAPVVGKFADFLNSKEALKKVWGNDVPWKSLMDAAQVNVPAVI